MKVLLNGFFINLLVLNGTSNSHSLGYLIGGFLAMAVLGYLTYSLIKPEKF